MNYRPISLTNCTSRVLERMVNKRLNWFLKKNYILSNFQSGFRKNRSTVDNLAYFESNIMEAFSSNEYLVYIFYDIEKAYDTQWRLNIIQELLNHCLKANLVHFVANFLKNRSFMISLDLYSSERVLENGIPQGSVLGVTLFIVSINSIFQNFKSPVV